ncbi:MAG: hypothetical protein ACT4RN_16600 [Pseudonocardia sp.]
MSRHRSPSGRHPHQRPPSPGPALPGAAPRPTAAHAAPARSALRNGLQAAAVTGGALALVMPALTVDLDPPAAPATDAALRLAAERQAVEPARGVRIGAPVVAADADTVVLPSVLPDAQDDEPEPPQAEAADLLKAAGLFDLARQREEQQRAREAALSCDAPLGGLGRVRPWVRTAAQFLSCLYGEPRLIGVASRGNSYSGHPLGLAVDFMVDRATGDGLAACALRNREALGIDYVIWKQRVNYGDGWERMEDRGGITANHFDHVHVSFQRGGGDGDPLTDVCG